MPKGQVEAILELFDAVVSGNMSMDEFDNEFDRITEYWNSIRED